MKFSHKQRSPISKKIKFWKWVVPVFMVGLCFQIYLEGPADAQCSPPTPPAGATNRAPVLAPLPPLTLSNLSGVTVEDIVPDGSITDPDSPAPSLAPKAIAVISVDNTIGQWEFNINDGSGWHPLESTINDCNATLLDALAQIRFNPQPDSHGNSVFSFRAWDQTFGNSGLAHINTTGNGDPFPYSSNVATVQIVVPDTTPPSAPGNLQITSTSPTQITLTWAAASDPGGGPVPRYDLARCQGTGCTPVGVLTTMTTRSYTDTSVTANTTYAYRVRAEDAAGNQGPWSSQITITTSTGSDTTPPSAPDNLQIIGFLDAMTLGWHPSTDNVEVKGYRISRNNTEIGSSTQPQFTDTNNLNPATAYTYMVRAFDEAGNVSQPSAPILGSTLTTGCPDLVVENVEGTRWWPEQWFVPWARWPSGWIWSYRYWYPRHNLTEIKNIGTAIASSSQAKATLQTGFSNLGQSRTSIRNVMSLAPGETTTMAFFPRFSLLQKRFSLNFQFHISVVVDENNAIHECEEGNNISTYSTFPSFRWKP